eukprot:COSAG02_NODE_143_length_34133_cov_272.981282_13_plen_118_part_00
MAMEKAGPPEVGRRVEVDAQHVSAPSPVHSSVEPAGRLGRGAGRLGIVGGSPCVRRMFAELMAIGRRRLRAFPPSGCSALPLLSSLWGQIAAVNPSVSLKPHCMRVYGRMPSFLGTV